MLTLGASAAYGWQRRRRHAAPSVTSARQLGQQPNERSARQPQGLALAIEGNSRRARAFDIDSNAHLCRSEKMSNKRGSSVLEDAGRVAMGFVVATTLLNAAAPPGACWGGGEGGCGQGAGRLPAAGVSCALAAARGERRARSAGCCPSTRPPQASAGRMAPDLVLTEQSLTPGVDARAWVALYT